MAISDPMFDAFNGLGLSPDVAAALRDAAGPSRILRAGDRLAVQGDEPAGLILILGGVVKACRNLENGLVQTLALFAPGDLIGGQALALGREAATLAAVSNSRYALVPLLRLRILAREHPELVEVLWRSLAREAAILQEWMVGMGRRPALSQIAHLLCEMAVRLRVPGRVSGSGDVYAFPLTQAELADAAGLSPVHVNRILQALRTDGLIAFSRGQLRIGDWRKLAETADFDPTYLEMPPRSGDAHAALLLPSGDARGPGSRRDRVVVPDV
jgi:CRP-like cAMP-binding protein